MNELLTLQNPWWTDPEWTISGVRRIQFSRIIDHIDAEEIVVLKGARQTGKTFLLRQIIHHLMSHKKVAPSNILYLSLDDRKLRQLIEQDGIIPFLQEQKRIRHGLLYVFVDEFQKADVTNEIKLLYENTKEFKFFLSGSSSLVISKKVSESLLGRTRTYHLFPFSIGEVVCGVSNQRVDDITQLQRLFSLFLSEPSKYFHELETFFRDNPILIEIIEQKIEEHLLTGGYPKPALTPVKNERFLHIQEIVNAYIEKDIVEHLRLGRVSEFRNTMELMAHFIARLFVVSSVASDLKLDVRTLNKYRSILEHSYMIDFLSVYSSNKINSLKKAQKLYFIDTGIRNLLAGTFNETILEKEKGDVLENFVFTQLTKYNYYLCDERARIFFWRNASKNEVDFILRVDNTIVPIEVKVGSQIRKGFKIFLDRSKVSHGILISQKGFSQEGKVYIVPASVLAGI